MLPKVKICGMTNREDAIFSASAGADMLGFIFYDKSPRYIEPSAAATIIGELPPYVTPVGVFVNETRTAIERIINETGIRALQLSGEETPQDCQGYSVKIVKAFRIRQHQEIDKLKRYTVSAFMLDGAPEGKYGGSGTLPDFSIALEMKELKPLFLAGGINPENVVRVVQSVGPYALDVNSGVEETPGKKDHKKVALLFERLNRLESSTR